MFLVFLDSSFPSFIPLFASQWDGLFSNPYLIQFFYEGFVALGMGKE